MQLVIWLHYLSLCSISYMQSVCIRSCWTWKEKVTKSLNCHLFQHNKIKSYTSKSSNICPHLHSITLTDIYEKNPHFLPKAHSSQCYPAAGSMVLCCLGDIGQIHPIFARAMHHASRVILPWTHEIVLSILGSHATYPWFIYISTMQSPFRRP